MAMEFAVNRFRFYRNADDSYEINRRLVAFHFNPKLTITSFQRHTFCGGVPFVLASEC
jgi:hypothetical protein